MFILQRTHTVRDQRDACFDVFLSPSAVFILFSFLPSLQLFTIPLIFPLLSPTFFSPPSSLTSLPLSYFLSPYPPPSIPQFHPTSIPQPPFSPLLSNHHTLPISLSSLSLSHTQWPICECNGQGVAPGALYLQHLPAAVKQHHLCV